MRLIIDAYIHTPYTIHHTPYTIHHTFIHSYTRWTMRLIYTLYSIYSHYACSL
jgi:hypothetical protein